MSKVLPMKKAEPERQIELRDVETLIPYARNARTHTPEQIAQIAASILEFGWTNPILIDEENGIVAGHARVLAAQKLGKVSVPCIVLAGLTKVQRKAYVLADNKLAMNAGWDANLLKLELEDLKTLDFDLELTGFDAKELASYLQPIVEDPITESETQDAPAISKKGDMFALGRHRLLCGDSSDVHSIEKVLGGAKPELLLYDPPYEVADAWTWAYPCERALIFTDYQHLREAWGVAQGYFMTMQFIWDHETSQFTNPRPLQQHRSCFYCSNDCQWLRERAIYSDGKERKACARGQTRWGDYQYDPLPAGCRYLSTVYREGYRSAVIGKGVHGKPVDWIRCLLGGSGAKTVLDMFAGSGTSLIAAPEDVTVFAIELDERKVDGVLARWERYTRSKARLITPDTASSTSRPTKIRPSRDRRADGRDCSQASPIA